MINNITLAYARMSHRERIFLSFGGVALFAMVTYGMVIEPMLAERARLEKTLPTLRMTAETVERYASEIALLKEATGAHSDEHQTPMELAYALETSATTMGMEIKIKPTTTDENTYTAQGSAPFPKLFHWLEQIRRKEGLAITTMKLTSTTPPENVTFKIDLSNKPDNVDYSP